MNPAAKASEHQDQTFTIGPPQSCGTGMPRARNDEQDRAAATVLDRDARRGGCLRDSDRIATSSASVRSSRVSHIDMSPASYGAPILLVGDRSRLFLAPTAPPPG